MATIKFKEESPYQHQQRTNDPSDYLFSRYMSRFSSITNGSTQKAVEMAIFGLGRAGTIHLSNMMKNSRCKIKYIVEQSPKRAKEAVELFGISPDNTKCLTPDQMSIVFEDPSIRAVVIATPTFEHENVILKALNSGKAVMSEKPIGPTTEGVKRCYNTSEKNNQPLLCCMNRRFDPGYAGLKDKVHSGIIGQLHMFKTVSRDSPLPGIAFLRTSGGIIHDCVVHDIDLTCWILGEFPEKVSVVASAFIPEIIEMQDHDTVAVTMKFPSGAISITDVSRNAVYGYDQRIEAFGPKGMLSVQNGTPDDLVHHSEDKISVNPIYHSFPSRYNDAYINELDHFIDIIQGLAKPRVTRDEVLKVSAVCAALEESIKTETMVSVKY